LPAPNRSITCPTCGITYGDFRTGLTYEDIYLMYWRADPNPATWVYKRRHTILGKWMQIKRSLWAGHVVECERAAAIARLRALYPDVDPGYWTENVEVLEADDWIPF